MINTGVEKMKVKSPERKSPKKKATPGKKDVSPMRTKRAAAVNCLNNIKDNPNLKWVELV